MTIRSEGNMTAEELAAEEAAFVTAASPVPNEAAGARADNQPGAPADKSAEGQPPKEEPKAAEPPAKADGEPPAFDPKVAFEEFKAQFDELKNSIEERFKSLPYVDQTAAKALLDTELQKVYGKFGDVTRTLNELGGKRTTKVTAEQLKAFRNEWGDDFAAAIAEDLSNLGTIGAAGGLQREDVDKIVADAVAAAREAQAEQLKTELTKDLPKSEDVDIRVGQTVLRAIIGRDWEKEFKSPEFTKFMTGQPAERVKLYQETVDPVDYIEIHRDFKSWQTEEAKKAKTEEERKKALLGAAPVEGDGGEPPKKVEMTEEEAMVAAFNSGR